MAFGPNPPAIQVHLCVKGGVDAIAFYEKAFGGVCTFKQMAEDGKRLQHGNVEVFGSEVMMHDEFEYCVDVQAPAGHAASLTINVNLPNPVDVDATIVRAHSAGATITLEAQDTFWGTRYGRVRDPFGHVWAFNAPLKAA